MQIYKLFSEVETFFKNNIGKTAFKGLLFGINDEVRFDHLLVGSWFMCSAVVKTARGLGSHVLGMLKSNVNKFPVGDESLETGQMVARYFKVRKRCRKYRCEYIVVNTLLEGIPVRLFLCRRTKQDGRKTLLTSDTSLSFVKAHEIYAMRWPIEVCFKECKQYLRLEGNQAQYFNSQIAPSRYA